MTARQPATENKPNTFHVNEAGKDYCHNRQHITSALQHVNEASTVTTTLTGSSIQLRAARLNQQTQLAS
jgi:hypothetical protein